MPSMATCHCCSKAYEAHLMLKCCICKKLYKNSCMDIAANEVRTLNSNKGYNWTCKNCREFGQDLKNLTTLILKLQEDISALKTENLKLKESNTSLEFEEVIAEINERKRRKNNLVIFNIPESNQQQSPDIILNDEKKEVLSILNTVIPPYDKQHIKLSRLGSFVEGRTRPIKVALCDVQAVHNAIKNVKALKTSRGHKNIRISFDRTPRQLQYYKKVRQQLSDRINSGDNNCKIKYVNDVPTIVPLN